MNQRKQLGATLALVAACIIVICFIGMAFFFVTRILGGGKELQNASDSGSLNVAKQALIQPIASISGATDYDKAFSGLLDSHGVDLLTYNRLVGQALLVALNAE